MKSETGREKGLALVLDMNEDRSVSFDFPDKVDVQEDDSKMTLDDGLEKDDIAGKVHVKLLAPFEGTAEGSCGFRSVKKIKGTKDFLAMSEDDRDCTRESIEVCMNKNFLEQCQCVPWQLATVQVILFSHHID